MATPKRIQQARLSPQDVDTLQRVIHAHSDYAHVSVRAGHGHLNIFVDDGEPVARCTTLGAGRYGLSFQSHTRRWEPLPIIADLTRLAQDLVGTLGPYLQRWDFPDTKSGLGRKPVKRVLPATGGRSS